ncbi:MAG TPA: transporter substrate-binding domain-containing protein, partial [Xanthobacteraceae bacterium]|nr:transporter substrate-binding domain-containing protein [Xanthobacteraceae bacterium]
MARAARASPQPRRRRLGTGAAGLVAGLIGWATVAGTETVPPVTAQPSPAQAVAVPGFWDPRRRPERPDLTRIANIRFLTEVDYPPFDFPGPDGNPAGFNVDLARMICEELKLSCTIQMRRFDTLISALAENRGDAVIASLAPTPILRSKVDFSD